MRNRNFSIFLILSLIFYCDCYGPVVTGPITLSSSFDSNVFDVLDSGEPISTSYEISSLSDEANEALQGGYWWLNKKSPFVAAIPSTVNVHQVPIINNEITEINTANPFLNAFLKGGSLCTSTRYTCVTKVSCTELGHVCAPKSVCPYGLINQNDLGTFKAGDNNKFCNVEHEVCCKIIVAKKPVHGETVAVTSTYEQQNYAASTGYVKPEYVPSHSIASTSVGTYTYTDSLKAAPHAGCAAALKCVPETYCTAEGVMSDVPVYLSKEAALNRVPLSECSDPSTGLVGKCCRDPNYKDPWPDHYDHDHGHDTYEQHHAYGHQHQSQEHKEHVQAPQYTTKKPEIIYVAPPSTETIIQEIHKEPSYSVSQAHSYVRPTPPTQAYLPPKPHVPPSPPPQVYLPPKPHVSPPSPSPPQVYLPPKPHFPPPTPPPQVYLPPPSTPPPQVYLPPPSTLPPEVYLPPPSTPPQVYLPPPQVYLPPPKPTYNPPPPQVSYIPPSPPTYKTPTKYISRNPYEPPSVSHRHQIPIYEKQESVAATGQCGVKVGDGAPYGEAPWYALIYSLRTDLLCGGVIVSENAILSSARCLEKDGSDTLVAKVGPEARIYKVATVTRHPEYDSITSNKDLAVVILKQPIQFDQFVQKICLPPIQTQDQSISKECYVSTVADYFNPGVLQKYNVQTIPFKDCETRLKNTYLGKYFILKDTFTCGVTASDVDLCQIKEGEPLVCNRGDGVFELYGIKSWDLGCKDYKKAAIFSNNDIVWLESALVAPLQKLVAIEEAHFREKLKGESLEGVDIERKPGFGLGYGK